MNFFCLLFFTFFIATASERVYKVVAQRFSNNSIINRNNSDWKWNYNAAVFTYFDTHTNKTQIGLIVRLQNQMKESDPYSPGPSYLAVSNVTFVEHGMPVATPIRNATMNETFFIPNNSTESHGTEDPRISYLNGFYRIFYTAYNGTHAMLSSAMTRNPFFGSTYQRQGYVFPKQGWSKSAASLFATPENGLPKHYLFWGDGTYPKGGIGLATSQDSITWNDTDTYFMNVRYDKFDSNLVESGPSPLKLKSGDFLFVYNSARSGYRSVKRDWELQYNLGFAILDEKDPTNILQRSDQPIMSPELPWEIGNEHGYLTPNVVFLEGLVPDPNGCPSNINETITNEFTPNAECFFGVYGAADSELGAVRIISSWVDKPNPTTSPPVNGVPIYKVVAHRFSNKSIINRNNSDWDFNYNTAVFDYVNPHSGQNLLGLVVRVQNNVNKSNPYQVGPSYMAISYITWDEHGLPVANPIRNATMNTTCKSIFSKNHILVFIPNNSTESHGTEDPRINILNGFYHLFYTAYDGKEARLSSAYTQHPLNATSYQRTGAAVTYVKWSKSGATLFATPENGLNQHYLFWGDSDINIAVSQDSFSWNNTGRKLLTTRHSSFDSALVESGPSPIQLKTGDYLFIHNSARLGYPSVKPNWQDQYNLGYAILSKDDPTQIVSRSDQPIMSPVLDWEVGNTTGYLTPNVVFLEGLVKDPNGCPSNVSAYIGVEYAANAECFFGVYGAADTELGAVRIIASYTYGQVTTSSNSNGASGSTGSTNGGGVPSTPKATPSHAHDIKACLIMILACLLFFNF